MVEGSEEDIAAWVTERWELTSVKAGDWMQGFPKSPVFSCISQNVDDLTGVEISNQHPGL